MSLPRRRRQMELLESRPGRRRHRRINCVDHPPQHASLFFQSCRILPHIFIPPSLPTDASIGNKRGQITSSMLLVFQHTAPNCHSASALSRHNKNNISHFGLDARNKTKNIPTHTHYDYGFKSVMPLPSTLVTSTGFESDVWSVNREHARANIFFDPWEKMTQITMLNDKKRQKKGIQTCFDGKCFGVYLRFRISSAEISRLKTSLYQ